MSLDDRLEQTYNSDTHLDEVEEAKQAILTDLLEIIGEDEETVVEDYDCPCGTNHHYETSYHQRNQLRQQLRDKVRKYCE